jgi:hypothetical protein
LAQSRAAAGTVSRDRAGSPHADRRARADARLGRIVEAFFSQFHEPVLPYSLKIGFGVLELVLLYLYLGWAGRARTDAPAAQ